MLEIAPAFVDAVLLAQETGAAAGPTITKNGMAALAVGLAAIGAGYAERGIGSAAIGAIAEDESLFGTGLIMTVLPETLVILALVTFFVG
ncbi:MULTISPECIES: F0F1 ATP synthase subunit C [Halorussus]|uniref:F0F1 ATP synthase subunit C n=1 Tax=Halorussus aquaticus TaxID=2953748 RepID=A0ABD5Q2V0_9EURY|nr:MULTISPECIES: F0F1 ATP synthase subunit C [Halorussus]NEU58474.1 F0F1 ATP synthase subunit C [Halorussus sp. MSC15.2]